MTKEYPTSHKASQGKQNNMKNYKIVKITKLPNSAVEIQAEIPAEIIKAHKGHVLAHMAEEAELPGFRKGKVPEKILIQKFGEQVIWQETCEHVLSEVYPQILEDEKIDAIGRPAITITKISPGNPFGFTAKTDVMPEVVLPDYKKISKEENKKVVESKEVLEVTEKEIEDVITQIQNGRKGKDEKDIPVFDNSFVKTLGDFTDVADFKVKAKAGILEEKKQRNKEKNRITLIEKIIGATKMDLPEILIESEIDKLEAQFMDDILRMGIKWEDYQKHVGKTKEDMRKDWRMTAEKKAKLQLILNQIALNEKITADKKLLEEEVKHTLEHYKDANPLRVRIYLETVLTNEKVFEFLEGMK